MICGDDIGRVVCGGGIGRMVCEGVVLIEWFVEDGIDRMGHGIVIRQRGA